MEKKIKVQKQDKKIQFYMSRKDFLALKKYQIENKYSSIKQLFILGIKNFLEK